MRISDWSSDVCSSDLYKVAHVESIAERIEIGVGLAGQIGYAIDCAMQKGVKDSALVPDQVVRRIMADMCASREFSHRERHSAQFPDQLYSSAENTTEALLLVLLTYQSRRLTIDTAHTVDLGPTRKN